MSVLLEALKKAALEKQRRDQAPVKNGEPSQEADIDKPRSAMTLVDNTTSINSIGYLESNTRNPNDRESDSTSKEGSNYELDELNIETDFGPVDEEFSLDIDFESLDNLDGSVNNETVSNNTEKKSTENKSSEKNDIENTDNHGITKENRSQDGGDLSDSNKTYIPDGTQLHSDDPSIVSLGVSETHTVQEDIPEQAQVTSIDTTVDTTVDTNNNGFEKIQSDRQKNTTGNEDKSTDTSLDDSEIKDIKQKNKDEHKDDSKKSTSQERKKEAFSRLLERNRQTVKKKKKAFVAIYITFAILLACLVAAYYYYIFYHDGYSLITQSSSDVLSENASTMPYSPDAKLRLKSNHTDSENNSPRSVLEQPIVEQPIVEQPIVEQPVSTHSTSGVDTAQAGESINRTQKPIDNVLTQQHQGQKLTNRSLNDVSSSVQVRSDVSQENTSIVKNVNKKIIHKSPISVPKKDITYVAKPTESLTQLIFNGYKQYSQGNFEQAQSHYQSALAMDGNNRDALLGLAAVAISEKRYDDALSWYQRRLNSDPKDDYAHAGIVSIASARDPSPLLMSKVNRLLSEYPEAAHLYFLQGALYSINSQWRAAQSAFFNAWSRDPSRSDYAFNLAVSLDHLGEYASALRFYRRVISNPSDSALTLDRVSIKKRISQLESIHE